MYEVCSVRVQMQSEEEFNEAVSQSKSAPLILSSWSVYLHLAHAQNGQSCPCRAFGDGIMLSSSLVTAH